MLIGIGVILTILGGILIWFYIPYSPVKREFQRDVDRLIKENYLSPDKVLLAGEEFNHLPKAIQRYIESCGYIGTPKMGYMKIEFHDVDFLQGRKGPELKIDYTQYNFVSAPARLALIDSRLLGIPFEGYDYYLKGSGGMKGVIGKGITLFDQRGPEMDKACLVTFLAESMFAPTILLEDYITFEEISDYEVKATITYGGQTVSGLFTFNQQYEMISFTTEDRAVSNPDGTMEYLPWSALCGQYQTSATGIKHPTKFQAVWHYPDGDFIYFDGAVGKVSYGVQ